MGRHEGAHEGAPFKLFNLMLVIVLHCNATAGDVLQSHCVVTAKLVAPRVACCRLV